MTLNCTLAAPKLLQPRFSHYSTPTRLLPADSCIQHLIHEKRKKHMHQTNNWHSFSLARWKKKTISSTQAAGSRGECTSVIMWPNQISFFIFSDEVIFIIHFSLFIIHFFRCWNFSFSKKKWIFTSPRTKFFFFQPSSWQVELFSLPALWFGVAECCIFRHGATSYFQHTIFLAVCCNFLQLKK